MVVGAGLAGLSCARWLHDAGVEVRILEAADDVGGRARTDEVDGFLLDRGFQVLLTAYPECRRQLDYRPERTTLEALAAEGFSRSMIDRFFRPFLGGIFLERDLRTSSRMFEFVYKMFSSGATAIPAAGMRAIPRQLAAALPEGALRTSSRVDEIRPGKVRLDSGEWIEGHAVVVASALATTTEAPAEWPQVSWCSTT